MAFALLGSLGRGFGRSSSLGGGTIILPPTPPYAGATIDLDPANGRYLGGSLSSLFPVARIGSNATDLLPTSASGAAYRTFGPNTHRITPSVGVLCEESRINYLLNSTAPATQTTQSLATGTYTLWVNGSGTATPSGGTATITGAAAASNGSSNTFVVTVAGTVVITCGGSLNAFQLELGGAAATYAGSSLVTTGATIGVRAADQIAFAAGAFDIVSSPAFSMIFTAQRLGLNTAGVIGCTDTGSFNLSDHDPSQFSQSLRNVTFLAVSGTMLSGTMKKAGVTLKVGDNAAKVEGGGFNSNGSLTAQTPGSLYALGNSGGASFLNGYFGRITLFATPLSSGAFDALIP